MEGKTCPVCGHKHTDHLTRQKNYEWHICPECDFAFIDQNLPPDETFDVESAERGESYIEFYGKKQRAKMRRAEKRARSLAGLMTGKRVLDVGCNLGYFVEACRQLGLDSTGLEISAGVVEQAKKMFPDCHFVCGFLQEAGLEPASFDAVYTSEVIEHVPDVNDFMHSVTGVLKSGGILYLTTPELKKFRPKNKNGEWKNLCAPNHRLYFSKPNMRLFLEKYGFKDIKFLRNWNFKPGIKLTARKI